MFGTEGDENHNRSQRVQTMVAVFNLITFLLLLWALWNFFSDYFLTEDPHTIESSFRDSFASGSDHMDVNGALWSTALLFLVFCLHQIRLWFGLNFVLLDRSFQAAGRAMSKQLKSVGVRFEIVLFGVLYALLFASMSAIGRGWSGETVAWILCAQAVVMVIYTVMVWRQFVVEDDDRIANRVVVVADVVHGLFLLSYFFVTIFPSQTEVVFSLMYVSSPLWVINELAVALAFLFVAEFWAVYWGSVGRVFVLITKAFSD